MNVRRFPILVILNRRGATTIWERWDGYVKSRGFQDENMNSFNHYALGAVGEWMYKYILGIRPDETSPGYGHFVIHPVVGGSLRWASGYYHSVAGKIGVNWVKEKQVFKLKVTIPANTTATVYLATTDSSGITESGKPVAGRNDIKLLNYQDGHALFSVGSGSYQFQVNRNQ